MSDTMMEKQILREAFQDVLHSAIYNRTKAQFSDAVGRKWIDGLKHYAEKKYKSMNHEYSYQPPQTKEALLYRDIFNGCFPIGEKTCKYHHNTVACSSSTAHGWSAFQSDPSARSIAT